MYTYMDVCVHHHIDIHCAQGVAYDSSCGGNSGWASPLEYFKTWKAVMGPRRWHTLLYIPIPGHATLGWELHGFASAVMLASTLFNSDTALKICAYCFWSEAIYVPWPHPARAQPNVLAHSPLRPALPQTSSLKPGFHWGGWQCCLSS